MRTRGMWRASIDVQSGSCLIQQRAGGELIAADRRMR